MINPSQYRVREFMQRIPNHLHRMDYDDIKIECNHFFPSIPVSVIDFNNEPFFFRQREGGGSNLVFRARLIDNPQNRGHESVNDISFISRENLHLITRFGRANKPNESMFYGAFNYVTACIEAMTKGVHLFQQHNSAMLTVGIWAFQAPMILGQMPYSERYFEAFYNTVPYKSNRLTIEDIRRLNLELKERLNDDFEYEVLTFFADEFAKFGFSDDYHYKLSNYYTDRALNRISGLNIQDEVDGIIYPSIANSYEEKNIVLTPEAAATKLRFLDAMQVWVTDPLGLENRTQFIPIIQNVSADQEGNLRWPGRYPA